MNSIRPVWQPYWRRRLGRSALLCLAWLTVGPAGTVALGQVAAEPPEPPDVRQWVAELDAGDYETRYRATENLIAGGGVPAVSAIQAAILEQPSTETQIRGFRILARIAVGGEEDEERAAHESLKAIAALDSTTARRAALVLDKVRQTYEGRATVKLKKLGARIATSRQFINPMGMGGLLGYQSALSIGDAWRGTAKDLELVQYLDKVTTVELSGAKIRDASLVPLKQMPGLRRILLKHAAISDDGFAQLQDLQNLEDLRIWYSPISDKSLKTIRNIKTLHQLEVFGTDILAESMLELQEQLKQVRIIYRRGGLLGVGPKLGAELTRGCMIDQPQAGSGAEKAGMLDGDVITKYRGHDVDQFDTLRDLIQHDAVGDKVEVEFLRGREKITRTVELGEWNRSLLP